MGARPMLTSANPDLSVPLNGFLRQLTDAIDRRFETDICDQTVGSLDEIIPEAAMLASKDVAMSSVDTGAFISNRSLRLAFFGFCVLLFDDQFVEEVAEKVPSLEDIGSVDVLADRFVSIVGQCANVAIDAAGAWRTEPRILLKAAKLLPEFLFGFSQLGEDEGRLVMMPDKGDGPDDDECIYQPSYRDDPSYIVWTEYWNRLGGNALFLAAMVSGLAQVPSHLMLFAITVVMRFGTFRRNIALEEFKEIVEFVAAECTPSSASPKTVSLNVN